MPLTTLVQPAELRLHLEDPSWVIVDCGFELADPSAGRRAYESAHIPGAVYAHLDKDLSGARTGANGRHPLPEPADLAARLGQWGIAPHTQVVAYDQGPGSFAARLWWLLRWVGHEAVAVLDGGLARWQAEGGPLSTEVPSASDGPAYPVRPRSEAWVDADQVAASVAAGRPLLDARAPERFRGELEPLDAVAGHIPGAVNAPFTDNLDGDGRFLPPATLAERFAALSDGRPGRETVCMCGSGVTACHNLLAMAVAGLDGARLYPGSWSEWCSDPQRPAATG